jgi:hypothetical protein
MVSADMASLLAPREEYESLRAWFADRAIEATHDGRINYDTIREVPTDP